MTLDKILQGRSGSQCELCGQNEHLEAYQIPFSPEEGVDSSIYACGTCRDQFTGAAEVDLNHWRCLNDSMWSQVPAVQVVAWRMLSRLSAEGWPQELLDMLYLEDDIKAWAEAGSLSDGEAVLLHRDSNGATLTAGDTVVLIKDLTVKGANFTAKRGTAVRNISLGQDNAEHIEGRVNGQQIVILTKFVKKS
jgi:protein PhnA